MKVAAIQMVSGIDVQANLDAAGVVMGEVLNGRLQVVRRRLPALGHRVL